MGLSFAAPLAGRDPRPSPSARRSRHFNPRAPCGARRCMFEETTASTGFQSTRPLRGATNNIARMADNQQISIHAPLAGRDYKAIFGWRSVNNFNPRAPCGARRLAGLPRCSAGKFQSTRPLRGATQQKAYKKACNHISIHAPLAGRDVSRWMISESCSQISIHAPLAGCDRSNYLTNYSSIIFQSTHPLRGATTALFDRANLTDRISIHAPLAGCDGDLEKSLRIKEISIHAPLAGRDDGPVELVDDPDNISIHAPLAGRDLFQPLALQDVVDISIHAPLAGRDAAGEADAGGGGDFNPRAPCGARPYAATYLNQRRWISIHAPLAGRDAAAPSSPASRLISIHAPLAGRDVGHAIGIQAARIISIHAPLAGRDRGQGRAEGRRIISIHAPLAGRDSLA